ncbi:MAG TPA: hypothetical protein VGR19_10585 [Allosphingosinicella sp.]|nr:hypothetical protein [Allosphingosinicella sp.]
MRKAVAVALLAALPAACVAPEVPAPAGPCPVVSAGAWRAFVDVMPGVKSTLNVVGKVTAPSGGYRIRLERGNLQEIHPQVQEVILRAEPPTGGATDALVTHDVSLSLPAQGRYGAVIVRCGSGVLAEIRPVGVAK